MISSAHTVRQRAAELPGAAGAAELPRRLAPLADPAEDFAPRPAGAAGTAPTRRRLAAFADLVALVKPRILVMALLTAAGAMSVAPGEVPPGRALWLILGTGLIVGSANTLNMWLERDIDGRMARTRKRPLPQRRIAPRTALLFGGLLGVLSLPALAMVGLVTAGLGLIALAIYVGVYTPMKQRSHWATWIGAIPGALPTLMGWTAATGGTPLHGQLGGLAVFGVLFFWQIPHFHAIALVRQRDYDAAGLKTLPGIHGAAAARRQIVGYLAVQVAVSLLLVPLGVAGLLYLVTAAALGAGVLVHGASGLTRGTVRWARAVFVASIFYLPVLFAVMVFDRR